MNAKELVYRWEWSFASSPAAFWPLVSNTDRFNRDCDFPAVTVVPVVAGEAGTVTNARRVRTKVAGVVVEWDEQPFEWVEGRQFIARRTYRRGPVAAMTTTCSLSPGRNGGTDLVYEMRLVPAGLLGRLSIPIAIGKIAKKTIERVLRKYDQYAVLGQRVSALQKPVELAPGGNERLVAAGLALTKEAAQSEALTGKLIDLIRSADDLSLTRIRCYKVADSWGTDRRDTLSLFLHATRAGVLDFSWDIVCPHCRGAKRTENTLSGVTSIGRCDSCDIDFTVDFDQSVELTFSPNPVIRPVIKADFCIGGPQVTPHIVAQVALRANERKSLALDLKPGRYRLREFGKSKLYPFSVAADGAETITVSIGVPASREEAIAPKGSLVLANESSSPVLAVVEHVSWTDQATSAAEVTSLQVFRDLFAREVLRPGEKISVGAMCVVFTDLKNSTRMYRLIGDAPAFGRVLTHFDILKVAVADHSGCIVKTMGDAVMAVFPQALNAILAVSEARERLIALDPGPEGHSPLLLKAGIHFGPCLAINQNDHLDYFGTSVNLAARLCSLSTGNDFVLSANARVDSNVAAYIENPKSGITIEKDSALLNGFGTEPVQVFRIAKSKV